jgi:peptide/nickel transport system substrate-binding protein
MTGMAAYGMVGVAESQPRQIKRGGVLRFATRGDAQGLDPHRNLIYLVSEPLAATTQGLLDLNLQCEPAPGVATEWDASKDLLTYTFKLRQGAQFHNGREIDAAAVKWNFERIQNPKTSHSFTRAALGELKATEVVINIPCVAICMSPAPSFRPMSSTIRAT